MSMKISDIEFFGSIYKKGGTSGQFLKADGSIDSNSYVTVSTASSTYLPLVGGILTGALSGTSSSFSQDSTFHGVTIGRGGGGSSQSFAYNTAIGSGALSANTTGIFNTAIGFNALTNHTTGNGQVAIGLNAGRYINSGANNVLSSSSIYIGVDSRASASGNSNEIVIGHEGRGNGNNTVTIGNSSITNNYFTGAATFSGNLQAQSLTVNTADQYFQMNGYNGATTQFISNAGYSSAYNGLLITSNSNNANSLPAWSIDLGGYNSYFSNNDQFNLGRKSSGGSWSKFLTIFNTGAATFLSTLTTVGLLTGQASIYQSDAGGLIASNRWGVYNGGATTMRFLYNPSGAVIWDNGSDRMTLNALGRLIVGDIADNGARIQTSGDIRADYSSSIYLEINGGAAGDYRKGFSGVNQLTGVARGLHLFNYDPDSGQGIKFYGGTFASKVRFGGFDNGGNFFVNSTDSAEGYKLYVNGSAGISGNLTINNTLSSPGNLIETAGLNVYLRPASGYKVFIDTGNGLSTNALDITGEVRYRGSIYDNFNFVASGNYTAGTYYNIVGVNVIPTGIYIFDGEVDTFAAGGGIYFMRFVSVPFYMWDVGSNSTTFVDLPPVLGTGHHLGNQFPSFRLQMTGGGAGIYLQFTPNSTWAGMNNTSGKAFRVNLKKIG
jgi:hypothetical protein